MWPFRRKATTGPGINARVTFEEGIALIDVRGQTCPGYLLAINKAVEALPPGTEARLLISYPPCGSDVQAWCRERNIRFLEFIPAGRQWEIRIRKPGRTPGSP